MTTNFHPLTDFISVKHQTNTGANLLAEANGNAIEGHGDALSGMLILSAATYSAGVAAVKAESSVTSGGTYAQIGSTVNCDPGAQHQLGLVTFYPKATGPFFRGSLAAGSGTTLTGQMILILFGGKALPSAQPATTIDAGSV